MKKIILALGLLSSLSAFAQAECYSDKQIDRKATAAKYLATIGFGEKQCADLKEMLEYGEACEDVKQETLNYASEVLDYMCD